MFFLTYKIIPNKKVPVKPAFQAALFTSLFWEVAKQLFGWYVLHLGRFSMVYGSLSILAIFSCGFITHQPSYLLEERFAIY
jgi:membrane protein